MHRLNFQEMTISMFSDANLRRPNVKYATKERDRNADEVGFVSLDLYQFHEFFKVVQNESNLKTLILALNNYRIMNR